MVETEKSAGELVTTSSELNSSDLQILVSNERELVIIKSTFNVAVFCSKTTRFVANIFENDDILCIWIKNEKVW
jgi:hypothetical protein